MGTFTFSRLELDGRLSNQMWQVSAVLSKAKTNKGQPRIPADWRYRPMFSLPPTYYKAPAKKDEVVDLAADRSPPAPYYQALRFLEGVDVRKIFAPSDEGLELLLSTYGRLLNETYPLCAIHVRRGDYVQHSDRFPLMTPHYYEQACKRVLDEFPAVRFLVFSDDIGWCRQNTDLIGVHAWPHEFIEGEVSPIPVLERSTQPKDVLDLWLMSRCQSIIIANSTFSWWAAYLSDAKVYYPDVWFGPDVEPFTGFPDSWTQIPC